VPFLSAHWTPLVASNATCLRDVAERAIEPGIAAAADLLR
jgi:hypothetical protein